MRDDLHKGAPVPRHWRTVIQKLRRDSDWHSAGPRAVEHALMRDLREIVSDPDVAAAVSALDAQQGLLLDPGDVFRCDPANELASPVCEHLQLRHDEGLRGQELMSAALGDALAERLAAHRRDTLAHVSAKDGRCVSEFATRFDHAAHGLVDTVLSNMSSGGENKPTALALDLEADLRAGLR